MIRLSRKTVLAVEAVLDIAFYGRADPVQAKEITARQGVPQRYLEQVMQQLVHEGVLKGVRGPRGGYTLAKERRRITVGEIVRIVARAETPEDGDPASRSPLGAQVVGPLWDGVQTDLLAKLDQISIETLCRDADGAGVPRERPTAADFAI